jgi:hypothetical protein
MPAGSGFGIFSRREGGQRIEEAEFPPNCKKAMPIQ